MYNFFLVGFLIVLAGFLFWFANFIVSRYRRRENGIISFLYNEDAEEIFRAIAILILVFSAFYFPITIASVFSAREFQGTYPMMKEFLENNPENKYESISFREQKLEINKRLFSYQFAFENRPNWTFVTEEIMEFEPIQ